MEDDYMYQFMNKYTLGRFLKRFYPSLYGEFKNVEDVYEEEIHKGKGHEKLIFITDNFLHKVSNRIGDKLFNAIQDWKYNFILR